MYLSQSLNAESRSVVIFIPHAGGSGESYMPWFRTFPKEMDCRYLQLPARGKRMNEAMPDSIDDLTDCILDELYCLSHKRIALFGHSMGGLIAFELARKMEINWGVSAQALFISSCRAPSEPLQHHFSGMDDEEFITQLASLGGTEASLLEQPELRRLFLPTLRQDIALCENYVIPDSEPLQAPLYILWGTEDNLITDGMISAWRKFSSDGNVHFYPHYGDHFYHQLQSQSVKSIIQEVLID